MSVATLLSLVAGRAAETEPPAAAPSVTVASPELTAAFAALREQQRVAEALLEQLQSQSRAALQENERVSARLDRLQAALDQQRETDRAALREAHAQVLRTMRLAGAAAGGLVVAGFVVAAFLVRALRRIAAVPEQLRKSPGIGAPPRGVLAPGDAAVQHVLLNGTVSELERRVRELESSAAGRTAAAAPRASAVPAKPGGETGDLGALLNQGRAALKSGQAGEALDCFDAVLRFEPCHVEALVKMGRALEMLGRGSEAIESYERALAADAGLAAAFLGKQGVVDLLEKSGREAHSGAH